MAPVLRMAYFLKFRIRSYDFDFANSNTHFLTLKHRLRNLMSEFHPSQHSIITVHKMIKYYQILR
jgi:hypothetical protein